MTETDVALGLFIAWLNAEHGRHFHLENAADGAALAVDPPEAGRDGVRLALEARPLLGPGANAGWLAQRDRLQEEIAAGLPVSVALWAPAGAELPADEPATSEFVSLVRQTAARLGPGERSHVALPVSLYLRKTSDAGGVVSATGALNPHWARFTERVHGTYDLDASRLHRLPESAEHLERLIDTIVERAGRLESGQWAEIETTDAWTIQRPPAGLGQGAGGSSGVAIIGVPPAETVDAGLAVRRNFRRLLAEAGPRLRQREADLRALVAIGYYARMEQEGATTAMRGYDPALYGGLDFVCLAADGLLKPLIQPPPALLPWHAAG
ncbi:MAG: hypothetical protein Q7T33_10625 [Dehalococcoidia bacterium]|nr:hypothetical protein [Dehalococcoidia bacterium]